jgi:hypothetical protein
VIERAWIDDLKVHDVEELATIPYALSAVGGLGGSPAPKSSKTDRPRYHGSVVRSRWYQERVFELRGYVRGLDPGDALARLDTLKGALRLGQERLLRFRRLGFPEDERIAFRVESELDAPLEGVRRLLKWGVTVVSGDPRIYSDTLKVANYDPTAAGVGSGIVFPIDFPIVFEGVGGLERLEVQNGGNVETPPILSITGPALNPIVDLETTLESIYTQNLELLADEVAVIDVAQRKLTIGSDLRSELVDPARSIWFELQPSTNHLRLRGSNFAAGTTDLAVSFRDARI